MNGLHGIIQAFILAALLSSGCFAWRFALKEDYGPKLDGLAGHVHVQMSNFFDRAMPIVRRPAHIAQLCVHLRRGLRESECVRAPAESQHLVI